MSFQRTSATSVELREGGGGLSLFGVPFFLGGIVLALGAAGFIPFEGTPEWWTRPLLAAMSVAFLSVGGWLVFGRRWLVIDKASGLVVRRHGLLVPMTSDERRLSNFDAVTLAFREGDSDTADSYPVGLRAPHGAGLELCLTNNFAESLRRAEFLSEFLLLPLSDTTTARERTVAPGEKPAAAHSGFGRSVGATTIDIPSRVPMAAPVIGAIADLGLAAMAGPVLWRFFENTHTPRGVGVTFLAFLGLLFCALPLAACVNLMMVARHGGTRVTASRAGLEIERRGAWGTQKTTIAAADILALKATGRGLIVESRQGLTSIGHGKAVEELQRLEEALSKALL